MFTWLQSVLTLRGNIRVLLIDSVLSSLFYGMLSPIWQPFVLSLGASMAILGGIRAILSLTGSIFSLFWGRLSDRFGRKPLIIVSNFLRATAFAVCISAQTWHLLILYAILMGLSASYIQPNPARSSLIAESVERRERGTAYSVLMAFSTAVSAVVAPLGGLLAMIYGFYIVFYGCIAADICSSLLIWLFVKETANRKRDVQLRPRMSRIRMLRELLSLEENLKGFYLAVTVDSLSWGIAASIFYGMLVKVHHFTEYQLGLLSTIMLLSWALSQIPIGKLIDKYGRKPFLLISEISGMLTLMGWLLSDSYIHFAMLQILYGILVSTWAPAVAAFIADSVPKEVRAEAIGKLQAFRGLMSFPSPYIGGILFDNYGFLAPIIVNLIGAFIAFVLILLFVKEQKLTR